LSVSTSTVGTVTTTGSTSNFNYTGITVPSGGSNTALICACSWQTAGTNPTGIAATWDVGVTNQTMTNVVSQFNNLVGGDSQAIFALLNPTPGLLNLNIQWTNACICNAGAVYLTGVDQTSIATSFINSRAGSQVSNNSPQLSVLGTYNSTDSPSNTSLIYMHSMFALTTVTGNAGAQAWYANNFVASPQTGASLTYELPAVSGSHGLGITLAAAQASQQIAIEIVPVQLTTPERPMIDTRLVGAGKPRGLSGMAQMFPYSVVPAVIPAAPAGGSTLPTLGVG